MVVHMEENITFKISAIRGYNKNEVHEYINLIHADIIKLEQDVSIARDKAREMNGLYEESQAELFSVKEILESTREEADKLKEECELQQQEIKTCIAALNEKEQELLSVFASAEELKEAKELVIQLQLDAHTNAKKIIANAETEANKKIQDSEIEAAKRIQEAQNDIVKLQEENKKQNKDLLANLQIFKNMYSKFTEEVLEKKQVIENHINKLDNSSK